MSTAPRAGSHGGDGARLARRLGVTAGDVLDLSASLNPVAPVIDDVLRHHLDAARRYPDAEEATAALATALDADTGRLLLTNGGSEAIALVAAEMGRGWVDEPDFSLYRRHLPVLDPAAARWRSNPHNPSGLLAPAGEHAGVWDEAFYPLATGTWTSGAADRGAVVVGSLTKVFSCPGLRIGYVLAPPGAGGFIRSLAARQPQWAVNGLALAVLPSLVAAADLPGWAAAIADLRSALVGCLRDADLMPRPSDANFVLVDNAGGLRDRLAARGILVRDAASFGFPGTVRIAVPDEVGLDRLRQALRRR